MKMIDIKLAANTFLLPAAHLLAVSAAASKDDTRYYLRGVFCEKDGSDVLLVTTNGHILMRADIGRDAHIGEDCMTQSGGFILETDFAAKAFKAKTVETLYVYGDVDTGILQFVDMEFGAKSAPRVGVSEFSRIDGTFPDYRRVIPSDVPDPKGAVCVDAALVAALAKGHAYVKTDKQTYLKFSAAAENDPINVSFGGNPELSGVIMPVRWSTL